MGGKGRRVEDYQNVIHARGKGKRFVNSPNMILQREVARGEVNGRLAQKGRHKLILITKEFSIDTSIFTGDFKSSINLEYYNGEWHYLHKYKKMTNSGTAGGSYARGSTTKETITYLEKLKNEIPMKIEGLNRLEKELGEDIGKVK